MKIFFCLPETYSAAADTFEKKVARCMPKKDLQAFRDIEDLVWMLCRPGSRCDIAILVAPDQRSLNHYVAHQSRLKDVKILLVLPDREPATALMGHKLYPRFLSYLDNDPKEVVAVLKNMRRQLQSEKVYQYQEVYDDRGYCSYGTGR